MKVKHFAITVTGSAGTKTTFPACNSKLQGRQWLVFELSEVTCKRCLKGVYPESLTEAQRDLLRARVLAVADSVENINR